MVTGVVAPTGVVVMVNTGDWVAPSGTTTLAGTAATVGLELAKVTVAPPAGAAPASVTVLPVAEVPPATVAGDRLRDESASGFTVRLADFVIPA